VSWTRPLPILALVVAGVGLTAVPAGSQSDRGLFAVTPSSQTVVKRPPAHLARTIVRNTTRVPLEVLVFPVLLGQGVDGAFTFSEAPRDLNAAAKILSPAPQQFTMPPGSVRKVTLRWNLLPTQTKAAFLGVIFQSKAQPAQGQQVKTVQRLLTVDFLRLPGSFRSSGKFTRLRASQGPAKTILFYPRMKNTGEFIAKPTRTKFRIRDASGKIVFRTPWTGNVILPGFQREFPIEMRKVLQAGTYTAVASADFGHSRGLKITEKFKLVGPNQLPTGRVTIDNFHGEGVLGKDSLVTGVVKSIGTAPATTAVRLDLYKLLANGQQPVKPMKTDKLEFAKPIPPGGSQPLKLVYPKLPAGNYRVIGTYRAEPGSIKEVITDWAPQKERSAFDKFKDWLRDHAPLLIGLGLFLLIALLVAYFLRRQRRLQRELEAARAGAPSPQAADPGPPASAPPPASDPEPPPAPASPAGVDINTADVTALQALPGVGPKAAERIVAHREEFGRFSSIDDLAQIEGFGQARVDGLRDKARI
jgi:competence ComEA-like helix-hairpin-helix protein